jgi:hypothetical protein
MLHKEKSHRSEDLSYSFPKKLLKMKKCKLPDRFYSALFRNLNEIRSAILERRALIGITSAKSKHRLDFFTLSHDALFNDMVAHAIKVLDKNKDSATFWDLYNCDPETIDYFIKDKSYDLKSLEDMADKLKHVRDMVLFHIDKKGVLDPKKIWKEANIKESEFAKALEHVFDILQYLRKTHLGKELAMPDYDGADATKIIATAMREGIIPNFADKNGS